MTFVILGHSESTTLDRIPLSRLFRDGILGVNMFFVISGFLITYLLLREQDRRGTIDVARFYLRRAFRIFPPFYVFLLVIALLRWRGICSFHWASFLSAATYTWNYNPHANGWILSHTWSLSLEESFYLVWPACMMFFSRRTCVRIAIILMVLSPLSRVATYALFPSLRGHIIMMLHTHIDAIMIGCLIALAAEMKPLPGLFANLLRPTWPIVAAVYLMCIAPYLEQEFRGSYYLPIGMTLTSLSCGVILLHAVRVPQDRFGKLLNLSWLRHIGVISYSLYLWQQLFTGPDTRSFPLNLLLILLCAESSYWLVERPSFWLRDRILSGKQVRSVTIAAA